MRRCWRRRTTRGAKIEMSIKELLANLVERGSHMADQQDSTSLDLAMAELEEHVRSWQNWDDRTG